MSFEQSKELKRYAKAIIVEFSETFEHLEDGNIGYLLTEDELKSAGKYLAGFACIPQVQSKQRNIYTWAVEIALGFMPDALIVIQKYIWEEFSDEAKVALMYHELRHIVHAKSPSMKPKYNTVTGQPIYEIVGHDVEEFLDVTELFGAWESGLVGIKHALNIKNRDDSRIKKILKKVQGKGKK
jgi:hypothetical protein